MKARWVQMKDVRWSQDGLPLHPQLDDLVLEEVIERMSKSRGNVINPDEVIESYGADAMRLYELFMGPFDRGAPWSTDGIAGVHRFLQRAWRLLIDESAADEPHANEFVCSSCFLVKAPSQLADRRKKLCRDCA